MSFETIFKVACGAAIITAGVVGYRTGKNLGTEAGKQVRDFLEMKNVPVLFKSEVVNGETKVSVS